MTVEDIDPDAEKRVRESFSRQRVMETLGARLTRVASGAIDIELPYRDNLTQQHGFLHAGIVTTIMDSACGYAAFSLMPPTRQFSVSNSRQTCLRPLRKNY